MGYKFEVETYFHDREGWTTAYQGQSFFAAVYHLFRQRITNPGRAYRMVVR